MNLRRWLVLSIRGDIMSKELYDKRKEEFKNYVLDNHVLPRVWKVRFSDNTDMRLWFNKILKLDEFKNFINEIDVILNNYDSKILNDIEKEDEFLNYIHSHNQIPLYGQAYFSDNDEMHSWYLSYRNKNRDYETIVHDSLSEYRNLDLAEIWSFIRNEFISIIKILKRIPNHGEFIIRDGIDVRVIYDKLVAFDPETTEKLLLHLQTYKKNQLSLDDRVSEFLECVSSLGYIPYIQESRFSDGTDMFTWYDKYKNIVTNLENEVSARTSTEPPKRKVNIYLIPNFRNTGGNFYTVCSNVGERLDLSQVSSFEEAKKLDDSLVKRGGVILKRDEEIDSIDFTKGKSK